jgi:Tol biopolymer transport system component
MVGARGGRVRLLDARADGGWPRWSANGGALAFSAVCGKRGLCVTVVRSGEHRRITHGRTDFVQSWSRDGERVLFVRQFPGPGYQSWLYEAPSSGGTAVRVGSGRFVSGADRSPDGSSLVVSAANATLYGRTAQPLYVTNTEGEVRRRLTHGHFQDDEPAWSPDGRWIAFRRVALGRSEEEVVSLGVYLVRPDGSGLHRLEHGDDDAPSWSRDSRYLAVSHFEPAGGRTLRIVRVDTSWLGRATVVVRHVTRPGDIDMFPAWRPA